MPSESPPRRTSRWARNSVAFGPSRVVSSSIREPVVADGHRLAGAQLLLFHLVVGARADDADREQDDRRVHDVPAVAPPVAARRAPRRRPATSRRRAPAWLASRARTRSRSRRARRPRTCRRRARSETSPRRGAAGRSRPRPRFRRATRSSGRVSAETPAARRRAARSPSAGAAESRRPAGRSCSTGPLTVICSPRTASDRIGNVTPQRIVRQSATSSRLL